MDNQKDNRISGLPTKQTDVGQYASSGLKGLNNNPTSPAERQIYEFVNKKTEKLITALYMVTDCMDSEDALKNKLRFLGVDLLSDMYKLSVATFMERHNRLQISISKISEILSFVDISSTIGFISEMNANILKREFNFLISELQAHLKEKQNSSFILDEKTLEVPRPIEEIKRTFTNGHDIGQYKGQIKDNYELRINNYELNKSKEKQDNPYSKQERTDKILSLIKFRGELPDGETGVSIKDISSKFTDCSEKTIQRELNDLVSKGKLKKTGEKRWSRYHFIT